jgi:hypothetical protein
MPPSVANPQAQDWLFVPQPPDYDGCSWLDAPVTTAGGLLAASVTRTSCADIGGSVGLPSWPTSPQAGAEQDEGSEEDRDADDEEVQQTFDHGADDAQGDGGEDKQQEYDHRDSPGQRRASRRSPPAPGWYASP